MLLDLSIQNSLHSIDPDWRSDKRICTGTRNYVGMYGRLPVCQFVWVIQEAKRVHSSKELCRKPDRVVPAQNSAEDLKQWMFHRTGVLNLPWAMPGVGSGCWGGQLLLAGTMSALLPQGKGGLATCRNLSVAGPPHALCACQNLGTRLAGLQVQSTALKVTHEMTSAESVH